MTIPWIGRPGIGCVPCVAAAAKFESVVVVFLKTTPAMVEGIKCALIQRGCVSVELSAHTFKSGSGNLAALRLSDLCGAAMAPAGEIDRLREIVFRIGRGIQKKRAKRSLEK